jgi:hypothetical protein
MWDPPRNEGLLVVHICGGAGGYLRGWSGVCEILVAREFPRAASSPTTREAPPAISPDLALIFALSRERGRV